jgi:hypothetical protein
LINDPAVASVALTLLDATWKAKRNVDKVMVALVGVLEMLPPPEAWPRFCVFSKSGRRAASRSSARSGKPRTNLASPKKSSRHARCSNRSSTWRSRSTG